jgi:hypothetical protein
MTEMPSKNRVCFNSGDLLNLGIHLPDRGFAEDVATVICVDCNDITVELCGSGFPPHLEIAPGTKGIITKREGRVVFQCRTSLKEAVKDRFVKLRLDEEPEILERREYARKDVIVRVHYDLPASQDMGAVMDEWVRLKNCPDLCLEKRSAAVGNDLMVNGKGHSRVNISGSGLRFKINDCLSYGTLLHLYIFFPDESDEQHIHAIGAIVRTKELLQDMQHNEQNAYYSTSMSFRMIDRHDRNRLMQYIFNEQRKAIV